MVTDEAKATEKILGLNRRDGLNESRYSTYWAASDKFGAYVSAISDGALDKAARLEREFEAYKLGKEPYSAFGRAALTKAFAEFKSKFKASLFSS